MESFAESSAQWPLLNIPGAFLRDWMPLIDEYHYCEYGHRHPILCAHVRIQIRPRSRIHVFVYICPIFVVNSAVVPYLSTFRLCVCLWLSTVSTLFRCSYCVPNPYHHCVSKADLNPEITPICTPTKDRFTLMQSRL